MSHSRRIRRRRTVALLALALVAAAAGFIVALPQRNHGRGARAAQPRPAVSPRPRFHRFHGAVPVLMYHAIDSGGGPYPELHVRPWTFAAQMRWLARHGYDGVTLARVEDAWRGGAALPRRPIVVSFDDGYSGDVRSALPVLRRLGWPGELNLVLTNLDTPGGLSRRDVRRLLSAGWELGAHTINHLDLTTLTGGALRHEVGGSREILQRIFRVLVENFAYPSGRFNARVVRAVRRAGFRGALTVAPGLARRSQPFTLARVRVVDTMGAQGLGGTLAALEHG